MSNDVNKINIPAFQRKRSLSAKARKKPSYMRTTKKRRTAKPRRKTRVREEDDRMTDIPIIQNYPSDDLFPDPLDLDTEADTGTDMREMKICGICEGYFDKIDVAVITVTSPIRNGDRIIFEKDDGLFEQTVTSMQIDRKDISLARSGSDIGIKVPLKPKVGTPVYKVI